MAKNCSERFNKILSITNKMAAICGADLVRPGYKMSWITWTVIVAINVYFCCTIYTIYIGMVIDGDWKVLLQTLSLLGSAAQGYSKLLSGIYHSPIMVSMMQNLDNIYKEYQKDKDYLKILCYRIDLNAKILKIFLWFYIVCATIIILYPLIYGSLYGEKLFVMQFLLPGIDPDTDVGYIMHNVVHVILICLGAFGNFAGDMYIFIFIIHIPLLKDILKIKFEKLNVVARKDKKTMSLLREIIEWHQHYNKFVKQVEECYYGVIFVQIFTSVMSICCTMFCIVIHSWPAAYSYLLYSSILLYVYCGLGNLVEISNEEVIQIIYCDCLWYELTIPEQKLILLMLRKSQRPRTLTVGQVMPLSMSTALKLTKAIYSYMMLLLNFLESEDM